LGLSEGGRIQVRSKKSSRKLFVLAQKQGWRGKGQKCTHTPTLEKTTMRPKDDN